MADFVVTTSALTAGGGTASGLAGQARAVGAQGAAAGNATAAACDGFGELPGALEGAGAKLQQALGNASAGWFTKIGTSLHGCADNYDQCEASNATSLGGWGG